MRTGGWEDNRACIKEDMRTEGQEDRAARWSGEQKDRWDNSVADSYSYRCTCATPSYYSVTAHILC